METALAAGRPVVTANKELIAAHGDSLADAAVAAGVDLLYEAAVAGAIPIIRPLRESLAGERIRRVVGIVNGTTNFILTMMSEQGLSYADALAEAQRLGFAERDPAADVDGHDAAAKAAILASLAFRCVVRGTDVHREGIASVDPVDIAFADRLGYVVKLLAVAERFDDDGGAEDSPEISVRVHPAMLPRTHPWPPSAVPSTLCSSKVRPPASSCSTGVGAGGLPTASAVLGDLIDAAHHLRARSPARVAPRVDVRIRPDDDLWCAWYLRIDVADRPGVLAAVAQVFGDHGVSIRSMEQVGSRRRGSAHLSHSRGPGRGCPSDHGRAPRSRCR